MNNQKIEITGNHPDWINLNHPDSDELSSLKQLYNINPEYLRRSLKRTETSYTQNLNDNQHNPLIVIQYPKINQTNLPSSYQIDTFPLVLLISKKLLVTSSYNDLDSIKYLIKDSADYKFRLSNTRDFILTIILEIPQDFRQIINKLTNDTNQLEEKLSSATDNNVIYEIMSLLKSVNALLIALRSNQPVISKILKDKVYFNSPNYDHLAELIQDEFQQSLENARYLKDNLEDYSDLVSTVISNNSNTAMTVLTRFNIILSVTSAIFSLGGVNYRLPLMNSNFGFYILLLVTFIIASFVMIYLHHKDIM